MPATSAATLWADARRTRYLVPECSLQSRFLRASRPGVATAASPTPQSTFRAIHRAFRLSEQVEDAREDFGENADAGIAYAQHGLLRLSRPTVTPMCPPGSVYLAAFVSRFTTTCSNLAASTKSQIVCFGNDTVSSCPTLVDQRANGGNGILDDDTNSDRLAIEVDPPGRNTRHFQQIVDDSRELTYLAPDDAGGLLQHGILDPLAADSGCCAAQQDRGIQDRRERIAKFMAEHRQKFVFAAVQVGQRGGLLLQSVVANSAPFRDIADVALNDRTLALLVDIADEFDFDLVPASAFQGEMLVANVAPFLQFAIGRAALVNVAKKSDLPQLLAQELVVRVAQQSRHERIGVDDRSRAGVQNQDAILGGLKKPPVTISESFIAASARRRAVMSPMASRTKVGSSLSGGNLRVEQHFLWPSEGNV